MRHPLRLLSATAGLLGLALAAPATAIAASPSVLSPAAASRAAAPAVPDELLVGYVDGAGPAARERARGRAAAQLKERIVAARADRREVELVRLPAGSDRSAAIAKLQADPAVAYAEPNWVLTHEATATDPYYSNGSLWGMQGDVTKPAAPFGSQADEPWAVGHTGSRSVYIGVIDEGIQYTHPELDSNVWTNPFDPADGVDNDGNGYVDDVHGWDFANGDNTIYDGGRRGSLDDHGTHVSGTMAAESNGAGVVGVNWQTTLISGKFLGRNGGSLAAAVQSVDYFTDLKVRHGLDIVATNNSWGGGGYSQSLLDAITRGARQNILFIAAAGNSGTNNDTTASYPSNYDTTSGAGYDAVVAVAAIDSSGNLASFSQYGAKTVDLGAPGVGIWSTTALDGYSQYNGTSMATPHVTGAAALYAATHAARGATLRSALLSTVQPTASLTGKTATGGRLDASTF